MISHFGHRKITNYCAIIVTAIALYLSKVSAGWNNMPLVLFPSEKERIPVLVVHYSGDAGYNVTDNGIGNNLSAKKIPVVGVNSLMYFSKARTPQSAALDLADIINHYSKEWNTRYCVVSGYSFGGDVVSFIVANLPDSVKKDVKLVVSTSPGFYADFTFHLTSWIGFSSSHDYPIVHSIVSLNKSIPVICFYGSDDNSSSGKVLADSLIETHVLDQGHRVGNNFDAIVSLIEKQCYALVE